VNGTLGIELLNSSSSSVLEPVYVPANASSLTGNARVGVTGVFHLNSSARLTVSILGSIRTIRDFTEGPSILIPKIQNAIQSATTMEGGVVLSRIWLDNVTSTYLSFVPDGDSTRPVEIDNNIVTFEAGTYQFNASFDYPQLTQLSASAVLNSASQALITQQPDQTTSLAFLSYSQKLLAGAWRFLTYFGRDSMISALLLQPVLSTGQNGAIEAVIGAVLERINKTDGSVCHEETIGDYATYLHELNNVTSTAPICSYIMIDSDYYLPVVMQNYFVDTAVGRARTAAFFNQTATLPFGNEGLTYADLALRNAEKIMTLSAPFAAPGGQTIANLTHLKDGIIVGEWRDSTYGIGGGYYPFDVNTALVPAALRAIAALSSINFFPSHPDWSTLASEYAQVWENSTLPFFSVTVPVASAESLLTSYVAASSFPGPAHTELITEPLTFHGLSLLGNDNQPIVKVMNTDSSFRLFLLNDTDNTQLTAFLNETAQQILLPFPAGLSTDVGLVVANPAYGGAPEYAANWTRADYHGTVVWGWTMSMMAKGLERQLERCNTTTTTTSVSVPTFCADQTVYPNVRAAYNHLWDILDNNKAQLNGEVWSWTYVNGTFQVTPLGAFSPTGEFLVAS